MRKGLNWESIGMTYLVVELDFRDISALDVILILVSLFIVLVAIFLALFIASTSPIIAVIILVIAIIIVSKIMRAHPTAFVKTEGCFVIGAEPRLFRGFYVIRPSSSMLSKRYCLASSFKGSFSSSAFTCSLVILAVEGATVKGSGFNCCCGSL